MSSVNKYYSGQGSLLLAERDTVTGKPKGFTYVGNVPELTLNIETTKVEHKESETGNRTIDLVLVTEKKGTFSFTLESLSAENLAMGLWGQSAAVASGTVSSGTPEALVIEEGLAGGVRYTLAHPKVSSVVVKDETDTTTYVAGTDYVLDADFGVITPIAGGAIDTAAASEDITLHVSYSYGAYTKLDAFVDVVAPERWLRFEGINTVDGNKVIVDIFRAQFDPLTDYGLINEELGSATLAGQILSDPLRTSGSKFFRQLDLA